MFTFMHLADAFIQSYLQCIQTKHFVSMTNTFSLAITVINYIYKYLNRKLILNCSNISHLFMFHKNIKNLTNPKLLNGSVDLLYK